MSLLEHEHQLPVSRAAATRGPISFGRAPYNDLKGPLHGVPAVGDLAAGPPAGQAPDLDPLRDLTEETRTRLLIIAAENATISAAFVPPYQYLPPGRQRFFAVSACTPVPQSPPTPPPL